MSTLHIMTLYNFKVLLLSVISFFGLIGNIGAIVLFATMKRQLKFHRLMLMLSAFDLFYVILSFMLFALPRVSLIFVFYNILIDVNTVHTVLDPSVE